MDSSAVDRDVTLHSLARDRDQFEITVVSSLEELNIALDKARFDVVLSDINLPELEGLQILALIRANGSHFACHYHDEFWFRRDRCGCLETRRCFLCW